MKLLEENDPFLSIALDEINQSDLSENIETVIDDMIKLMYDCNAIGLAANQIGLSLRLFVMHTTDGPIHCINPKVLKTGDVKPTKEGCLSFPALRLIVHRPNFIQAEYYDLNFEKKIKYFDGLEAVCFQHETDHLDGVTFDKRVSSFQFKNALKKRKRLKSV